MLRLSDIEHLGKRITCHGRYMREEGLWRLKGVGKAEGRKDVQRPGDIEQFNSV